MVNSPIVAITGKDSGRIMLKYVRNSPAPSIWEESISEGGILFVKNVRMMITLKPPIKPGIIRYHQRILNMQEPGVDKIPGQQASREQHRNQDVEAQRPLSGNSFRDSAYTIAEVTNKLMTTPINVTEAETP